MANAQSEIWSFQVENRGDIQVVLNSFWQSFGDEDPVLGEIDFEGRQRTCVFETFVLRVQKTWRCSTTFSDRPKKIRVITSAAQKEVRTFILEVASPLSHIEYTFAFKTFKSNKTDDTPLWKTNRSLRVPQTFLCERRSLISVRFKFCGRSQKTSNHSLRGLIGQGERHTDPWAAWSQPLNSRSSSATLKSLHCCDNRKYVVVVTYRRQRRKSCSCCWNLLIHSRRSSDETWAIRGDLICGFGGIRIRSWRQCAPDSSMLIFISRTEYGQIIREDLVGFLEKVRSMMNVR